MVCLDPDYTVKSNRKIEIPNFSEAELIEKTMSFLRQLDSITITKINDIKVPELLDSQHSLQPHQKEGFYIFL